MQNHYQIRINFKGGIISPAELKKILVVAKDLQATDFRFGLRQQLLFHIPHSFGKTFGSIMKAEKIDFQVDENNFPNIISSYVSEEVFQTGNWLTEGIYKDILDAFDYEPQLKINISDSKQSFTPFFSGHINFVASPTPNFWYLFIRVPKTNKVYGFDKLVFSNEISNIAKQVEFQVLVEENDRENDLEHLFSKILCFIFLPVEKELEMPEFMLPYYEGFNRYGNKTWLGIYRRNEIFSIDFLIEICDLCQKTKIGEICVSPWKSLIIKGIREENRNEWSNILFKNNINVRHAANELNWQVEDDSPEALNLKFDLVKAFDKHDFRTFGICFGIKTRAKTEVYASIMVRRRRFKFLNFVPTFNVYDISYTEDFNPNGRTKKYFAKSVLKFNLAEQLRRNVLLFNRMKSENEIRSAGLKDHHRDEILEEKKIKIVNQCPTCLTIYDEDFGDILNGIEKGIPFENLPESYCCSTCEAPKSDFKTIKVELSMNN